MSLAKKQTKKKNTKGDMCIKILYNITTFIWVYSNIRQQSSSMQATDTFAPT